MAQDQSKKRSSSSKKHSNASNSSSSSSLSISSAANGSGSGAKGSSGLANAMVHGANGSTNSLASTKALNPNRQLHELLKAIEPRYVFHPAVEELLLDMATQFVDDVVDFSSKICKHRRSTLCEPKDLQFCLAKNYGISLAGVVNATSAASGTGATLSSALTPSTAALAANLNDPNSLNALGTDVLVRSRPLKNSIHMHRMALKRKTLMKAKQPKAKLHRSSSRTTA